MIGLDINPDCIRECKRKSVKSEKSNNIEFILGNVFDIKFDNSLFDFIYSRFLFQHLIKPSKAIEEMKRVCATDGIICTEDIDHGSWLSYPRNSDLENLRKCLVQLLESTKSDP